MAPQPGKRFKARYSTTPCIRCATRIQAGDMILWVDGATAGYAHTNCDNIERAPEAPTLCAVKGEKVTFDIEDARRYIAQVKWQFAKSMPKSPHEYTRRVWAPTDEEFVAFVELIRREGEVLPWPKPPAKPLYRLTYLTVDGWRYWTMGSPIEETVLVNRADINLPTTA